MFPETQCCSGALPCFPTRVPAARARQRASEQKSAGTCGGRSGAEASSARANLRARPSLAAPVNWHIGVSDVRLVDVHKEGASASANGCWCGC